MAVAPVGGTEPWVGGDGQGCHLPCGVTSFFSFCPEVSTSITNYRSGLIFSSWGGEGSGEAAVTLEFLIVPWWQEGEALLSSVCPSPGPQQDILLTSAILCTQRGAHGECVPTGLPEVRVALSLQCLGWLCPQGTVSAAETVAYPAPKPHTTAPSALYGLVLLPTHQPGLCSGKVQFMNFALKVWAAGPGGKGEKQRWRSTYSGL